MEHGLGQLDVPKVSGAVEHAVAVGGALEGAVHGSQAGVTQAPQLGATLLIGLGRLDLGHRVAALGGGGGRGAGRQGNTGSTATRGS